MVVVDTTSGKVIAGPEVHARGFGEDDSVFAKVIELISQALEKALADGVTDQHQLNQLVRRTTGKWVGETHRRRPMIVPLVIES